MEQQTLTKFNKVAAELVSKNLEFITQVVHHTHVTTGWNTHY